MNRAMFSGVAGLKAHQTKMDVIGNNIANVNTYGYKSQSAVFSDIYYQTIKSASGGTTSRGGINPSSVGYGSTLAAIRTQMGQSSMQNTGYGMDVAITGEGFLQVMDADGNIFYTKAGLLDYDSNGYLTDINGNFVLGATTADGQPGIQKIKLDNIGSVEAKKPAVTEKINGVEYSIAASNATKYGNVSIAIGSSENLPAGQKAVATISNSGTITLQLNAYEKFSSMAELNNAINAAVKEANGGKEHAAGTFTVTASEDKFDTPLTGAQIAGFEYNNKPGKVTGFEDGAFGGTMTFMTTSTDFQGSGTVTKDEFTAAYHDDGTGAPYWHVSVDIGGKSYSADIAKDTAASSLLLKSGTGDYIQVGNPGFDSLTSYYKTLNSGAEPADGSSMPALEDTASVTFAPATASKDLGLSSVTFALTGGTEGGIVTLDQLTGIAVGSDGTISVSHPDKGVVVAGKISLANFANPSGLQLAGNNYYSATANSGEARLCDPGSDGTGTLKSNALEMSNVDLSAEFADMITTQRGFQANSRIITVSDTMLEELINLKR